MSSLKLYDAEGNYTNEFGDHRDAENQGILVNDQILGLHQSNQSVDGANTFPSRTSINGVPRKRKVEMNDCAKQKKEKMDKKVKRLKKENTSSESETVLMKDQCARMIIDLQHRKEIVDYLKEECNEVTDMVAKLSMVLIESNNLIQLRERIEQLEARHAQLRARIAQLVL